MTIEYKGLMFAGMTPVGNIIASVMTSWAQVYRSKGSRHTALYFRIQAGPFEERVRFPVRYVGTVSLLDRHLERGVGNAPLFAVPVEVAPDLDSIWPYMQPFFEIQGLLIAAELAATRTFHNYRRVSSLPYGHKAPETVDLVCIASLVVEDDAPTQEPLPYAMARVWEVGSWELGAQPSERPTNY